MKITRIMLFWGLLSISNNGVGRSLCTSLELESRTQEVLLVARARYLNYRSFLAAIEDVYFTQFSRNGSRTSAVSNYIGMNGNTRHVESQRGVPTRGGKVLTQAAIDMEFKFRKLLSFTQIHLIDMINGSHPSEITLSELLNHWEDLCTLNHILRTHDGIAFVEIGQTKVEWDKFSKFLVDVANPDKKPAMLDSTKFISDALALGAQ